LGKDSLDKNTDIKNPHMNLSNGEMLYATMHPGRHHSLKLSAPSMHSQAVTIA